MPGWTQIPEARPRTRERGAPRWRTPHARDRVGRAHDGPRLPQRAERRLIAAAAGGDQTARAELTEAFIPSIASIARRYRRSPAVSHGELMQEGVVGLLRALERYEMDRGTPFWAYASWWVRQAMQSLVAELTGPVVLSDRALRQLARVRSAQRTYLQDHGRDASPRDLADCTGLPREQVETLIAVDRTPRSLAEPIGCGDDSAPTLGDQLADPRGDDDHQRVFRRLEIEALRGIGGGLVERERDILRARYGLGCREHTLQEIATDMGLSAERVRQIEQRALDKLRTTLETAA